MISIIGFKCEKEVIGTWEKKKNPMICEISENLHFMNEDLLRKNSNRLDATYNYIGNEISDTGKKSAAE